MLKIRLTRRGKKNKAFYRLVVAEHTSPIKGRFIEALGFLNPHTKEKNFKEDRIKYWIEKGAQCSDSAHNMLVSSGLIKGPKRAVKMKKVEAPEAPKEEAAKDAPKVEESKEAKPEEKTEKPAKEKQDKAAPAEVPEAPKV